MSGAVFPKKEKSAVPDGNGNMRTGIRFLLMTVCLICITVLSVSAGKAETYEVRKTDIRAYINDQEIPSYCMSGFMAVSAADLCDFGFSVEFRPGSTLVNGQEINTFAWNGHRMLRFSELRVFGSYRYDNSLRKTLLYTDFTKTDTESEEEPEPLFPTVILHACGVTPDGKKYSNSMEALENSYVQGYRFLEVDFGMTADGELACVHDWHAYYPQKDRQIPTMARFLEEHDSVYGFTSLNADLLADWMRLHPDVYIVTDTKENNLSVARKLSRDYPDLRSRFVIQIYSAGEFQPVQALGFDKIIYTLYRLSYHDKYDLSALVKFDKTHPALSAFTFSADTERADFSEALCASVSVPVYTHTINDAETAAYWQSLGVYGIYADIPPA